MSKNDLVIQELIKWLYHSQKEYNELFVDKERYTQRELNRISSDYLTEFYNMRSKMRNLVRQNSELFKLMYMECKKSFLTFILWEGVSKDLQRNTDSLVQPVIPYNHQMDLINLLQFSDKHVHLQKSRRQGASLIMVLFMTWNLIFGQNVHNVTTHKDLSSLDSKGDFTNSTFGKIRLVLFNSMFVPTEMFNQRETKLNTSSTESQFLISEKRILFGSNSLDGSVLSPSTNVGFQSNIIFIDELDPACQNYPNQNQYIMAAISSSTKRMILYSTYRGTDYPFYQLKLQNNTELFDFITLDWRQHPLCTKEWYNNLCDAMLRDKVQISQELDFNPIGSTEGLVYNYISDKNKCSRADMKEIMTKGTKVIGSDFGGGSSHTVFICAYQYGDYLYLDNVIKSTQIDQHQIKQQLTQMGFDKAMIYGDISGTFQSGAYKHDWRTLLQEVGLRFTPVPNQGMLQYRNLVNFKMLKGEIMYNKDIIHFRDLTSYKYGKDGQIEKNSSSHLSDALSYLVRFLYNKSGGFGFI